MDIDLNGRFTVNVSAVACVRLIFSLKGLRTDNSEDEGLHIPLSLVGANRRDSAANGSNVPRIPVHAFGSPLTSGALPDNQFTLDRRPSISKMAARGLC